MAARRNRKGEGATAEPAAMPAGDPALDAGKSATPAGDAAPEREVSEAVPSVGVGDRVLYVLAADDVPSRPSNVGEVRPADVLYVVHGVEGGLINLSVLLDGTNDRPGFAPEQCPGTVWCTSVPYAPPESGANGKHEPGTWHRCPAAWSGDFDAVMGELGLQNQTLELLAARSASQGRSAPEPLVVRYRMRGAALPVPAIVCGHHGDEDVVDLVAFHRPVSHGSVRIPCQFFGRVRRSDEDVEGTWFAGPS